MDGGRLGHGNLRDRAQAKSTPAVCGVENISNIFPKRLEGVAWSASELLFCAGDQIPDPQVPRSPGPMGIGKPGAVR